ncbi:diacylglycerol/lipid kinase family protein [Longispora albida]|uniref:diacylglycerol/lipid kinase family protein n=1 Tax=Longispora albida TaxID=203523 RepID=UPI000476B2CC|nr:diacylglycerol kinase family protein [Longispora albida]
MRALLVVNPKATTTNPRSRDVLIRALGSALDLRVGETQHRGHAAELAAEAVADGLDLVVTLGGDGTINETVNGMLEAGPLPGTALAVVPGGSTNVFARALGLPNNATEATGVVLEALREGRSRTIGLGRADSRYFTFCAGFGMDAAVTRRVERSRRKGRTSTPALYLRATIAQYATERASLLTLHRDGHPDEAGLAMVVVQNTAPWTYLNDRPVNPSPEASFELGLDVMALRKLRLPSTLRTITQILSSSPDPHGKQVFRLHDAEAFTVSTPKPLAFQLDGDYLGERRSVEFRSVAEALRVVC